MERRVITEVEIPALAEAIGARGYALVAAGVGAIDFAPVAAILRRWGPGIVPGSATVPEIAITPCTASLAAALDAGAADAMALPVDAAELAARLDARIRHHAPRPIRIGDLQIDPVTRRVHRAGRVIALQSREYALLFHLAERRGAYVSRRDLLAAIWRLDFDPGTNVVAVHVSKLRAKLDRGFSTPLLHSARRLGYRLGEDGPGA